jgi:hypothetical protein
VEEAEPTSWQELVDKLYDIPTRHKQKKLVAEVRESHPEAYELWLRDVRFNEAMSKVIIPQEPQVVNPFGTLGGLRMNNSRSREDNNSDRDHKPDIGRSRLWDTN